MLMRTVKAKRAAMRKCVAGLRIKSSFVEKWAGKFKTPKLNPSDPRLNYLIKKYIRPRQQRRPNL
jgi:hypothetical protein